MRINREYLILSVFSVGFVAILYNFVSFVARNAVNIPFWDQWSVADIITGKMDLLQIILYQHNEHRIGVGLLIMKSLAMISNWSQIYEIIFISLLIVLSSLILIYIRCKEKKQPDILDLFIPLIILNTLQIENLTWGFQIAFVLPLFFLCLWILALRIRSTEIRYLTLSFLSLLSAFSSFHGLILPLLTIGLALLDYCKYKSLSGKLFIAAALANIAIICSYFIGFTSNFQTNLSFGRSWETVKYFSLATSNGFFFPIDNTSVNIAIVLIVISFLIYGTRRLLREKQKNNDVFIGCLLISFSLAFASLISIGRSSFGLDQALASRYITFTMLAPLGLFFIFSSMRYGNYLKTTLLAVILFNSIFFAGKISTDLNNIIAGKRRALDCYQTVSAPDLDKCYKTFTLFPNEQYLDQRIMDVLRYKRLNEFN